jgi:hypothetical protein
MPSIQPKLPPYQDANDVWHCGARTHQGGKPCKRPAPEVPHRCSAHGGKSKGVAAKQARARLEEAARRLLVPSDVLTNVDPISRLLELAAEADAFRGAVAALVNDLNERIRYRTDGGEQLRAEVVVYERALDRAARLYLDLCKLNLDERLMRIREREAAAMLTALEGGLADAGLTDEQQKAVKGATARHLRAVS